MVREYMAELKGEISEIYSSPESREFIDHDVSVHDHTEGDDVASLKSQSSFILTARVSSEQAFESLSTGNKHDSKLVYEGNSKCDVQSSVVVSSARSTSVKSDISTEVVLAHDKGSFQMNVQKMQRNHSNGSEDSFHAITLNPQQNTESSCSNSLPVILPVSLSNNGSQDISKEAIEWRSHEPVTVSSESAVSNHIARRAVRNARTRNIMKISSVVGSHSQSLSDEEQHAVVTDDGLGEVLEQTDMSIQVSGNASYTEELPPGKEIFCSGNSDTIRFSNQTRENIRLCDGHERDQYSHSVEGMLSSEVSDILVVKGNPPVDLGPGAMDKTKGGFLGLESSESSMATSKVAVKNQDEFVGGFDLNEDINANGMDDFIQPAVAVLSSPCAIHVVARPGVPRGLPVIPLVFEGELGWKGSAITSAFSPATLLNHLDTKTHSRCNSPNEPQRFTGIDLNAAVIEDNADKGFMMEHDRLTSLKSWSESESKQTLNLNIDLNEEFTQSSVPCESENRPLLDLNLNANASVDDTKNEVRWLHEGRLSLGNTTSDLLANSGKQDSHFTSHPILTALSNTQHVANHAHAQQYLVAVTNAPQSVGLIQRASPLQPKLAYANPALSAQNYPFQAPFDLSPSGIHYSGMMPHARYSHERGIPSEPLSPGRMNSLGAPQLVPVACGHNTAKFANSTPELGIKTGDQLPMTSSKVDEARQSYFLARSSPIEEHMKSLHQEAWYSNSTKRKEPEVGFEFYQLGYRQMT